MKNRKTYSKRTMSSTKSMTYTFISPRGKKYQVSNLSAFARRFKLDRSAVSRLANGIRKTHKNWIAQ